MLKLTHRKRRAVDLTRIVVSPASLLLSILERKVSSTFSLKRNNLRLKSLIDWPKYVQVRLLETIYSVLVLERVEGDELEHYNCDYFVRRTTLRLGDRAFSDAAPRAWNRLPSELKTTTCSIETFKRRLKTFLFNTAFSVNTS